MNPPRFVNRLLGSLPAFILLILVACGLCYDWWVHQDTASGWLPVIALFVAGTASNARKEVTSYRNWKRSWDAMEGRPPPSSLHGLKAVGFLALVGILGQMAFVQLTKTPPVIDEWAIGFLLLSVLGLLYQLEQRRRDRGPRVKKLRATKSKPPYVATVCLPVPKPGHRPALSDLPSYCQQLLLRR